MSVFDEIESLVNSTFTNTLKDCTLDFLYFIKNNKMNFKRLFGYWKNQNYYSIEYNNKSVCYILINGIADEKRFSPLTIWTDDSISNWYEKCGLTDDEKQIVWNNVDFCDSCGTCKGGSTKKIFGKSFDNVCRTTIRFINPNKDEFILLKKIILLRKTDIQNDIEI